ncbi:MAG: hypothetical protein HOO96_16145 [Polyangiaceae bacterium]|nr:hypothetical protein [Polyangiaceae bacterium]
MKRLEGAQGETMVGRGRQLVRATVLGLAATAVLGAAACQSPTQMRMVLRTDLPCGTPTSAAPYALNDLSIFVASNDATLRERIQAGTPSAYLSACTRGPGGELGTLYLTPDGSDIGMVAVMAGLVHGGAGATTRQSAQTCTSASQENCLLSTRRFRYSTHQTGVVPVLLEASCVNHRPECAPGQTCRAGACASDVVDPLAPVDDPLSGPDGGGSTLDAGTQDADPTTDGSTVVPSVVRCAQGSAEWTPDPPVDVSCVDPAKTLRCLTQKKDGTYGAICQQPGGTTACLQPCCSIGVVAGRVCCVSNGVPIYRTLQCGVGEGPACFGKGECAACNGTFDDHVGFGKCAP